jgi:glycerol kinase
MRIDGGMASNDWFAQCLADLIGVPVERPRHHESTAFGAALLGGITMGLWPKHGPEGLSPDRRFHPQYDAARRAELRQGWQRAVGAVLG